MYLLWSNFKLVIHPFVLVFTPQGAQAIHLFYLAAISTNVKVLIICDRKHPLSWIHPCVCFEIQNIRNIPQGSRACILDPCFTLLLPRTPSRILYLHYIFCKYRLFFQIIYSWISLSLEHVITGNIFIRLEVSLNEYLKGKEVEKQLV